MTQTDNLALPFILPSQAQKHITHNEALLALDAIIHLHVVSRSVATSPKSPSPGDRYIVADRTSHRKTNAFSGQGGKLAAFQDGIFQFYRPQKGWLAYISDEELHVYFNGSVWQELVAPDEMPQLGVNAKPDEVNRFAVSSQTSLFNHIGNGHQLKINKAKSTDTASFLFQTGRSDRCEIGLTGDDRFQIKTSADGIRFNQALSADKQTGFVAIGNIAPSANLTVANQVKISSSSSSSSLSITAMTDKTRLVSTPLNGKLEFNQNGNGRINFKINNKQVLALQARDVTLNAPLTLSKYGVANLPPATSPGQMIYVTDASQGSCIAFSDGTNWLRSEDRSVVT